MAESYDNSSKVLAAMDRLWFHQIIFSSDPTSVLCSKTALQSTSSSSSSSSESSLLGADDNNASTNASTSSITPNDTNDKDEEKENENCMGRKRPSRLNLISNKFRSKSSSPSVHRPQESTSHPNNKGQKLQRFLSCSKLHDLELEELKGFMDLGFKFEKDQLSPRTKQVLPGLLRVEGQYEDADTSSTFDDTVDEGNNNEEKTTEVGNKPYLSEAWMVKRPNSPLLRLRMARVSRAEDMKKCLKLWARTVATSVQPDE
ncbi:Glutamate 5-kinase [Bienertia sinuspersici]